MEEFKMAKNSKASILNPKAGKGVKTSKKNMILITFAGVVTAGLFGFSIWFAFLR